MTGKYWILAIAIVIIALIGVVLDMKRMSTAYPERIYFTPHGILQNPYHAWPEAPSGVLRSTPAMGFEWVVGWGWNFVPAPKYTASLKIGISVDGRSFYKTEDFVRERVNLYSKLHSKNVMSYDWQFDGLAFSFKFFLVKESSLACLVDIKNDVATEKTITLHAIGRLFSSKPYSVSGLRGPDSLVLSSPALDLVLTLGSTERSVAQKFARMESEIEEWIKNNDLTSMEKIETLFLAYGMMSFELEVPAGAEKKVVLVLSRGDTRT
ncbi:TPA: hypothetical protein EYP44_04850, partial [Candidatus Bathyarchaeota archaeon]|nr:hypothetical protein [Candidatus Bathyarchaeota archaeon]